MTICEEHVYIGRLEFLDMGDEEEVVCPYCSTLYRHDASLSADQTVPAGCTFNDPQVAAAE